MNLKNISFYTEQPQIQEFINVCKTCQSEYTALKWNGKATTTGFCDPCSQKEVNRFNLDHAALRLKERAEIFKRFCPPMYFYCDVEKLPLKECYEKVMRGLRPKRGLILIGGSRLGKTRSAYALLKGLYLEMEKSCFAITELQLSHEMSKFGKSEAALFLLEKMCRVEYLLIDDLGKSVMTQRVVAELYYVIEERIAHHKQTIVTMQLSGTAFEEKMAQSSGKDMAEAIMKRLRENSDVIEFKIEKEKAK